MISGQSSRTSLVITCLIDLDPIDPQLVVITISISSDESSNTRTRILLPLNSSQPIRGELEVTEFGRQYLIDTLTQATSIPLLCFIDAFGLYRNIVQISLEYLLYLCRFNRSGKKDVF